MLFAKFSSPFAQLSLYLCHILTLRITLPCYRLISIRVGI